MKQVIIGTAGHVDHGKTLLVKALTGIDTDRLQEEKKRGITIELGFAHLDWEDGTQAGIVDVPGLEKFIRNMLAGADGVDLAMLVVPADEGFMPQTVEHLGILTLRGIREVFLAKDRGYGLLPAIIISVAGALLFLLPMTASRLLFSGCGAVLLATGVWMLLDKLRHRRLPPDKPDIIDAL